MEISAVKKGHVVLEWTILGTCQSAQYLHYCVAKFP